MNGRRRDAPRIRTTHALAAALILIGAGSPLLAARSEIGYAWRLQELYSSDVFRFGGDLAEEDFVTTVALDGSVAWRTARSDTLFRYSPEYFIYALHDDQDHLDHQQSASWVLRPGRHSSFGVRQNYLQATRQTGFRDPAGDPELPADPVVVQSRRVVLRVEPHYELQVTPRWSMQTRALYLSQEFEEPSLSDSTSYGMAFEADARVTWSQTLGGRIRLGQADFEGGQANTTPEGMRSDRLVGAEAVWSQQEGAIFRWRVLAGLFRVRGDDRPDATDSAYHASAIWNLERSDVAAAVDRGPATSTGAVATSVRESGSVNWTRRWGASFRTSARGAYIRFENIGEDPTESFLEGYSVDLGASYSWQDRWRCTSRLRRLIQEQRSGRNLDYYEVFIGFGFTTMMPVSRVGLW